MNGLVRTILLFLFSITSLYAQITDIEVRTNVVSEERVVVLNGKLRDAVAGGQSRIAIPIDLPNGTIEWYYSFTTTEGKQGTKNLNLAIQLSSLVLDPSGVSAKILSRLEVPGGTNAINVYVLSPANKDLFLDGDDFEEVEVGSSESTKEGLAKVADTQPGRWYLGLQNPSALDGVNVSIEAVALVTQVSYTDEWSTENLSLRENACLTAFLSEGNDEAKQEICRCFVEELQATISPRKWANLGPNKTQFENGLMERCFISTGHTAIRDQERILGQEQWKVTALIEESNGAYKLSNYQLAKEKLTEAALMIQNNGLQDSYAKSELADIYDNLSWYALLTNDLKLAEQSLQRGQSLAQDNMSLWANTGLFHLLSGNDFEAEQAVSRYKRNDRLPDDRKWHEAIGNRLDSLERLGLANEHFETIRTLLKIK